MHLLLRALRGQSVERTPVWAMRQAGRWDPEFRRVRAGSDFYSFSADVERAAEASLCPKRFGVDAIILFYDITTLPVSMGLPFQLKSDIGPSPDSPIRSIDDLNRLCAEPAPESYAAITGLLRTVKERLRGELPVLVFAGAPFTVATYCIGTGKNIDRTRQFAAEAPRVWEGLLDKLNQATGLFLKTLITEGADAYQLFDSWAGMLTETEYDGWAQRYHRSIFQAASGVPRILFVKECPYLERMTQTGCEAVSLGKRHNLAEARRDYPELVFQGNVDEEILRTGSPETVKQAVRDCLRAGGGSRHILNLNHGVGKETPPENFAAYVTAAREFQA